MGLAALSACVSTPEATAPSLFQGPQTSGAIERSLESLALQNDDTIVTRSARTVGFNGQALIPRYVYTDKNSGGQDLVVQTVLARFVVGLNEDVTVGITVPYVNKRLSSETSPTLHSDGLADVPIVGKYRFFQETGPAQTTEAAVIFGLELPTGRTNVVDESMRLPQPLQPGSGSLDTILGAAFTRVDGRWLLNSDLLAKINSEADDYRFGNTYRFDVGVQFRLYPARYERFDQTTVNLVAELNTSYAEHDTFQGSTRLDTGGLKMFATPGIQVIVSESALFEAAVQLPVLMNLHGSQLEENFVTILGMRILF